VRCQFSRLPLSIRRTERARRATTPSPAGDVASLLLRAAGAALIVQVLLISPGAAQKEYSYEGDPIRVGTKALEKNDIAAAKTAFEEAIANNYEVPKANFGLAEVMVRSGRFEEAETLYREALSAQKRESGKGLAEAHAGLGLLLIDSERWDEGAEQIHAAYKLNSGHWPAIYGEARLQLRDRKWDKAKSFLDWGAARKGVAQGEDLYHRGMAFYYLGTNDLQAAEKEALTAFHMNPVDPRHGVLVAQVYEKRNVPALAIAACEEVLRTPGLTPTASFVHFTGTLYQKAERYNEARDKYLQAMQIDSTYAPVLKDLAGLFVMAKQYENASKVYLRYLEEEPDDLDATVGLVTALSEAGRSSQALASANKAMQMDSTRTDVRIAYARAAIRGRDRAAQQRAATIYNTLPDDVELTPKDRTLLAEYQIENKDLDGARRNLSAALAADSTFADAYYQRGLLAFKTNQADSAAANFRQAIRLDPKVPLYHLNLGVAQFQLQRMAPCIAAFRSALALDPKMVIGHTLLGQAYLAVDSLDAARSEFQEALRIDPKNARAFRGLGFLHLKTSSFDDAAEAYQSATESDPRNADGWAGLGQAYLGLRNWDAAESAFRRAQSIDPNNASLKSGRELLNRARQSSGG
jgi:tetratricopeptide (TPR) repeat protein